MTLKLPSNSNGDIKTFDLWKAWSIWPQHDIKMGKENYEGYKGQFYHLHPEFVEKRQTQRERLGTEQRFVALVHHH